MATATKTKDWKPSFPACNIPVIFEVTPVLDHLIQHQLVIYFLGFRGHCVIFSTDFVGRHFLQNRYRCWSSVSTGHHHASVCRTLVSTRLFRHFIPFFKAIFRPLTFLMRNVDRIPMPNYDNYSSPRAFVFTFFFLYTCPCFQIKIKALFCFLTSDAHSASDAFLFCQFNFTARSALL